MKNQIKKLVTIYRIVFRLSLEDGGYILEYKTIYKRRYLNKLRQIMESDNRDLLTLDNYVSFIPDREYTVISYPLNDDDLPF